MCFPSYKTKELHALLQLTGSSLKYWNQTVRALHKHWAIAVFTSSALIPHHGNMMFIFFFCMMSNEQTSVRKGTTTAIHTPGNNLLCVTFFCIAKTQCEVDHLLHTIHAKWTCERRDIAQRWQLEALGVVSSTGFPEKQIMTEVGRTIGQLSLQIAIRCCSPEVLLCRNALLRSVLLETDKNTAVTFHEVDYCFFVLSVLAVIQGALQKHWSIRVFVLGLNWICGSITQAATADFCEGDFLQRKHES